MNNENQYYTEIEPYIQEGLIREVYATDKISILNLADKMYMINLIDKDAAVEKYVSGFVATHKMVSYVSKGMDNYYKLVVKLGNNAGFVGLTEGFINALRKYKIEALENGPSNFISHELEEELANKQNKERGR